MSVKQHVAVPKEQRFKRRSSPQSKGASGTAADKQTDDAANYAIFLLATSDESSP